MATKRKNDGIGTANVISVPTKQFGANIMFGTILKERRKKANISQKDFADMMHVTRNTIINWEADKSKPDYSLIPKLCTLLGIQLHELFHMQAENGLTDQEDRVIGNFRLLSPTSRRVVDKMISTMVEEELLAKDQMLQPCTASSFVLPV